MYLGHIIPRYNCFCDLCCGVNMEQMADNTVLMQLVNIAGSMYVC